MDKPAVCDRLDACDITAVVGFLSSPSSTAIAILTYLSHVPFIVKHRKDIIENARSWVKCLRHLSDAVSNPSPERSRVSRIRHARCLADAKLVALEPGPKAMSLSHVDCDGSPVSVKAPFPTSVVIGRPDPPLPQPGKLLKSGLDSDNLSKRGFDSTTSSLLLPVGTVNVFGFTVVTGRFRCL